MATAKMNKQIFSLAVKLYYKNKLNLAGRKMHY
jgi:hypothetical protein